MTVYVWIVDAATGRTIGAQRAIPTSRSPLAGQGTA
jgi:hypothetical protein